MNSFFKHLTKQKKLAEKIQSNLQKRFLFSLFTCDLYMNEWSRKTASQKYVIQLEHLNKYKRHFAADVHFKRRILRIFESKDS